jgi:hypothetical protein
VNAYIDIFEISYEESVSYFKRLENLEKIKCFNYPNPASLPVDNKKTVSVTSSVGKSSKNHKVPNMWCHYCDKNNHNKADCRELNALKRQLNPEKNYRSKKRKAQSILSTEINLTTSSDEDTEVLVYFF